MLDMNVANHRALNILFFSASQGPEGFGFGSEFISKLGFPSIIQVKN